MLTPIKNRYGKNEFRYAYPIADALVANGDFRSWLIAKTKFAPFAESAVLLHEMQKQTRGPMAENWWRSYWIGSSYQYSEICGQRETDLLAVFEASPTFRFALHVEVKAPGDKFRLEQAADYKKRAECWAGRDRAPWPVVPHDDSATLICCPDVYRATHGAELAFFDAAISFEEIADWIPDYPPME